MLWLPGNSTAASDQAATTFAALRAADMRLATVLYRLSRDNEALCLRKAPLTGLVLQGLASYDSSLRAEAIRFFGFESAVAVEGVVPDSAAASAGVRRNDSLIAVDGRPVGSGDRAVHDTLAMIDGDQTGPITLTLRRDGKDRTAILHPVTGCLAHAQVDISDDLNAQTDGETIQVDSALMNLVGDDQELAATVAHELAHIVLDHPRRLTAAHVDRGLFKGFGRSSRLFKKTEEEADRLSVTLMANAGYDPMAAVRYWQTYGPKIDEGGGLGSTHPSWRKRVALIASAAARIAHEPERPIIPDWINSRLQPLR